MNASGSSPDGAGQRQYALLIQKLIAEGNDEQLIQLLLIRLLDFTREQKQERYEVMLQIGKRYLALASERVQQNETSQSVIESTPAEAPHDAPSGREDAQASAQDELVSSWLQEAVGYLSSAIDLFPERATGYVERGLAYAVLCQFPAALADYATALMLTTSPQECAGILYQRGIVYMLSRDYAAGTAAFRLAVSLDKGRAEYLQALRNAEIESEQQSDSPRS